MLESSELQPVVEFLQKHAPFSQLDPAALVEFTRRLSIEYARRGASVGDEPDSERVYIVRSGAIREVDAQGVLLAHYGEGDSFGVQSRDAGVRPHWEAMEDALLYSVQRAQFDEFAKKWTVLAAFFAGRLAGLAEGRAALTVASGDSGVGSLATRVAALVRGSVVQIEAGESIRSAAVRMRDARVSSLVVMPHGAAATQTLGIVTDRDLRNRVIAEGRNIDEPVGDIMSSPVVSIGPEASLLQALVKMVDHRVHHLVVLDESKPVGVLTLTDWMRVRAQNPVYLLNDIQRQANIAGLAEISERRQQVLLHLMDAGIGPEEVHALLTTLGDAITRRLIALVSDQLRDEGLTLPEGGWCWVAFGSQARNEQGLGSDQDNGLILDDAFDGAEPAFVALAERVCAGLNDCGFPFCNGGIMASQKDCRLPLEGWKQRFKGWIYEPSRDAVMRGSIFFDMRAIEGDARLTEALGKYAGDAVLEKPLFIAHLARDALARRPPLGFFRQLVVEPGGEHADTLDIKHRGVIPIVDLARVYALESSCAEPTTRARLKWAHAHSKLSESGHADLSEALEIIQRERLWHQVRCIKAGRAVDNYLRPDELSGDQRRQLRDAFRVVQTLQSSMEFSHQLGNLSG